MEALPAELSDPALMHQNSRGFFWYSPVLDRQFRGGGTGKYGPAGAFGDAANATADLGASILTQQAKRLANLLAEVQRFDLDQWFRMRPSG